METRKVLFKELVTDKEVYVDVPVATDEARAYYTSEYIIRALSVLKLFVCKTLTESDSPSKRS